MKLQQCINKLWNNSLDEENKIKTWKRMYLLLDISIEKQMQLLCLPTKSLTCEKCKAKYDTSVDAIHQLSLCSHFICKKCILTSMKEATNELFNDQFIYTSCPVCQITLKLEDITAFISFDEIRAFNIDATKNANGTTKCPVCTLPKQDENLLFFECGHFICDTCALQFQDEIAKGRVPCCSICLSPISFLLLQNLLDDPKIHQRGFDNTYQTKKGHTINKIGKIDEEYEILTNCPNCLYKFSIATRPSTIQCPKSPGECFVNDLAKKVINFIMCILCSGKGHFGKTCQEYAKEDPHVIMLLSANLQLRICPYCGMIVTRIEGCNMMTCESSICQQTKSFCFICGQKIEPFHNYSHFGSDQYKNCYGQYCVNFRDPSGKVEYKAQ